VIYEVHMQLYSSQSLVHKPHTKGDIFDTKHHMK